MRCLNSKSEYVVHASIGRRPDGYSLGAYILCDHCSRASIVYKRKTLKILRFNCMGCDNEIYVNFFTNKRQGVEKIDVFV